MLKLRTIGIRDYSVLEGGQRIGLIRFGSRVDVYMPAGAEVLVAAGQTAIGGETVLAELPGASASAGQPLV